MVATTAFFSSSDAGDSDASNPVAEKEAIRKEFAAMSQAMIEEEGLLNHAQAAIMLEISTRRVGELVELGIFHRFDFVGRTYVSMREVRSRAEQEIKAGRPRRNIVKRTVVGLKAAVKTDAAQFKLGGFNGPYEKAKEKRRNNTSQM